MNIVRAKGEFIILAGDESGMITAGQIKDQSLKAVAFGAHNDSKIGNGINNLFIMNDNQNIFTLGGDGTLRHWTLE